MFTSSKSLELCVSLCGFREPSLTLWKVLIDSNKQWFSLECSWLLSRWCVFCNQQFFQSQCMIVGKIRFECVWCFSMSAACCHCQGCHCSRVCVRLERFKYQLYTDNQSILIKLIIVPFDLDSQFHDDHVRSSLLAAELMMTFGRCDSLQKIQWPLLILCRLLVTV